MTPVQAQYNHQPPPPDDPSEYVVTEAAAERKRLGLGVRVEPAFCRMCLGFCGINVTIQDGRVTKVAGDPTSPLTHGFTCSKGRSLPD